jgi:hypothetical protein
MDAQAMTTKRCKARQSVQNGQCALRTPTSGGSVLLRWRLNMPVDNTTSWDGSAQSVEKWARRYADHSSSPALIGVASSDGGRSVLEPVSAQTQPVSGGLRTQISDIENSAGRDATRESARSVREVLNSSSETKLLAATPRKCRVFAESGGLSARDRRGWLPLKDSNPSVSIRWSPPTNPRRLHRKGSFRDPLGPK